MDDLPHVKTVLDSIELFPSDMLEDMISDFMNNPVTAEIWFTATENHVPVSIGYCAPEQLTQGTYNLLAIGVRSDLQGKGIGQAMMAYLEEKLRNNGHRVLIVETSGTEAFELTRKFYTQMGYSKEAVIRDFWKEGDDKVVFWKRLNA